MKKIAALPSLLTLANLACGFQALSFAAQGQLTLAAWMVVVAMVFDGLDGKVARLTGVSSHFGAELDSLADVVSFGAAPAFLVSALAAQAGPEHPRLVWLSCMVFAVCAALRLARFNVEHRPGEEDHQHFHGLPTPAAAGQVVSLIILHGYLVEAHEVAFVQRLVPAATFFTGVLMVSRVRYPHAVNRLLSGNHTFADIVFLVMVALLVATLKELTLAVGFTGFTLAGVLRAAHQAVFHRAEEEEPIF
ncbi:MAG: CDP-diacylglycerol--serine O-phosphatidyltransferase [Candidatus Brocadiia bacterium]